MFRLMSPATAGRVRLKIVQTGLWHTQDHVSRDGVKKAVTFRQAWQEDRVEEGAHEGVEGVGDQQGRV
ncbi:MAG TPA: hypothetical protein VGF67_31760 [Ktedonobacteraceae bacterium]